LFMSNKSHLDRWENPPEFPSAPLGEEIPSESQLKESEMRPEEVVDIYQRQIKPYEKRARPGMRGFLSNVLHMFPSGRVNRPNEMRDEAQDAIEFRKKGAYEYSQRNLPELQAMAAKEANTANKEVGQPPFENAVEVKERHDQE
jgi:hypothetical protein